MSKVLDQVGHFAQGVSVVLPWGWLPPWAAAPISSSTALFWRELSQLRRSNGLRQWKAQRGFTPKTYREAGFAWAGGIWVTWHLADRLLDILFGGLGGLAFGLLIHFLFEGP